MSLLENITLQMSLDDHKFEKEFKDVTKMTSKQMDALTLGAEAFEARWEDITANLRSVKRVASGLAISAAIYTVTDAVTGASSAILNFRNNLEASKISMEYFAQESNQALEYIRELEDFAAYTPFSTESAISMAQYLQAMSVPINSSKSVLKVISDTAAATGSTEDNMQRIVTALGQILTKGKLAAEEVRQLANANIPIYDILKEQLNLTGQQIKNLGNLNINASKAVVAILDGLKDRYEGASEKIADTLGGMTETIKDDALIIGEAFFHGTLDRLEDRITGIRDKLDEWRDISLHYGTGGMIEAIIGDLDKDGKGDIEQLVIAAVAGFKNLGDTIREFTTRNGTLLKTFAKTAYTGIMSLTIAADYLLRTFNTLQQAGEAIIDNINKLTGMSLTLSDVVTGLLVFKTVGKTLYFAGNTALWAGKQFINLGTSLTAVIPVISSANAFTKGLTAGLITLSAAAVTAYLGLKAIQGATGVTDGSKLVTDEYKQQMEEYNDALSQWEESLNQDYSAIADNWAASMSGALDDTEKKANKTAKKIQKTWLMSFDEVFQIREDPDDDVLDDELEKFKDIDWGQFFTLPEFRFPERQVDQIVDASYNLGDAINTAQSELGTLNMLLPGLITGATLIGTILKNRKNYIDKVTSDGTPPPDDLLSEKELKTKLDDDIADFNKTDDLLNNLADEYNKQTDLMQDAENNLDKMRNTVADIEQRLHNAQLNAINSPTTDNAAIVDALKEQLKVAKKQKNLLEAEIPNNNLRAQAIERIAVLNKLQEHRLQQIHKRQALTGDMRDVLSPGRDKAANAVSAHEINKRIDYIQNKLDTLAAVSTERNSLLRDLKTGVNTDAIKRAIDTVDSRILRLSADIDSTTTKIASSVSKYLGGNANMPGLDASKLDSILNNNLRSIKIRINSLTKTISTNNLDALTDIADKLNAQLTGIKKSLGTYTLASKELGIATDPILLDTINKQTDAVSLFYKRLGPYADRLQELEQHRELMRSDTMRTPGLPKRIQELENNLIEYRTNATVTQDIVKLNDEIAGSVVNALDALTKINSNLSSLLGSIDKQRVSAVYSIATEAYNLISSGTLYSTSKSLWYDRVYTIISELQNSVHKMPGIADINKLSENLLNDTKRALGMATDGDKAGIIAPLSTAIEQYKNDVLGILHSSGAISYDVAQSALDELKKNTVLTTEQTNALDNISRKITQNKANIDKLTISEKAYVAEKSTLTKLDDVAQQLTDLAAASTGGVRQLYDELASAVLKNTDANSARVLINEILNKPESVKALGVGNTAATISNIWRDSNITKLQELRDTIIRMQDAAKPVSTATSGTPMKGLSVLLDNIIAKAKSDVNAYKDKIASIDVPLKRMNTKDAKTLIDAFDELKSVLKDAEETGKSIGMLIEERFDITGLYTGTPVPDAYLDRMQHIATAEQLNTLITEVEDLVVDRQRLLNNIEALQEQGTHIIEDGIAGKFDTSSLKYYNDDAYQRLLDAVENLQDTVNGIDTATLKANKKEVDAVKWLATEYGTASYVSGGFEKATGAYKFYDFFNKDKLPSIYKGLYDADNGILKGPIEPALQNLRLGTFAGSMTQQGTVAQGTIAAILGENISDELVQSISSELQKGMAMAFNTRTRSVLRELFGNISIGDTGADSTGMFGIKLSGFTELESGIYGLVQRIALSEGSAKKLMAGMSDLVSTSAMLNRQLEVANGLIGTVNFSDFERTMRDVAPDIVNKIASDLIAGKNLKGIVFSVLDAANEQFEDITKNVRLFGKSKALNMQPDEIKDYAQKSIAEAMRFKDMSNSVYADHMRNIIIMRDQGLDDFKKVFVQNAQLLKDAAEAQRLAREYNITLDLTPTTTYGTNAGAYKRYEDVYDAIKTIRTSADSFEEVIEPMLNAAKATDDNIVRVSKSLDSFDRYVKAIVSKGLKSGNIREVQEALKGFEEAIRLHTLRSFDNLFVDAEQFKFNLMSTDPAEVFDAVANTITDAQQVLVSSIPKQLATYNDMSSKILRAIESSEILRAIENISKDYDDPIFTLTETLQPSFERLRHTLERLQTEFNILIATSQKLENAFGMLDHPISSRWLDLKRNGNLAALNSPDPFRYLNLEESVGKMFADIETKTGKPIGSLIYSEYGLASEDIVRFIGLSEKYKDTLSTTKDAYKVYNKTTDLQIPYIGNTTDEEIIEFIDAITSGSNATDSADTIGKLINDSIKDTDVTDFLPPAVIKDIFSQTADVEAENFWSSLKNSFKSFGSDMTDNAKSFWSSLKDGWNSFKDSVVTSGLKGTNTVPDYHDLVYSSVEEFLKANYSPEMQQLVREAVGDDAIAIINEQLSKRSGFAPKSSFIEALYSANDLAPNGTLLNNILEKTTGGLTGRAWYDAMLDPTTMQKIIANSTDEQAAMYGDLMRSLYSSMSPNGEEYLAEMLKNTFSGKAFSGVFDDYGTPYINEALGAFIRGEGFGDAIGAGAANKEIRNAAKEVFGEDFKAFDDIVKAVNNPDYVGGSFAHKLGVGLSSAMENSFVKTMITPSDTLHMSGLDVAFALKQSIDAMSVGIDEYNNLTSSWEKMTGYEITPLNKKGELNTTGNMTSVTSAIAPGVESLIIEGILQNLVGDAIAGGVTSALGITGVAGGLVSLPVTAIIATATAALMAATGGYKEVNINSESYKKMLNNQSWAYDQAKAQGASDEEARKIQLDIQRSLYLDKYNEMSSIWSGHDKASIANLTVKADSIFGNSANTINGHYGEQSLRYAINELAGKDQNGWSYTPGNAHLTRPDGTVATTDAAQALNAAKVYEQLYALYTSGGVQNIEAYNNKSWWGKLASGFNGTKLTDLESDWRTYLGDMDALTRARTDDLFRDQMNAAGFIAERGMEATQELLAQYGIICSNMQGLQEGVILLYEAALNQAEQKLSAKADFINAGDNDVVDISVLATGSGSVGRLLDGDLSGIDQTYLDLLADSTGIYINALSDTMYSMAYDIEEVRDKMTGFTVTFPDKISVGAEKINVEEIRSDTNAVSILNGMGININADGTVTVSTEAVNANESGHNRTISFSLDDVSAFELEQLSSVGVGLYSKGDNTGLRLTETSMTDAVRGLTYNLTGIDLTNVASAAIEALKEQGISLTQDSETGRTVATITDAGYITGSKDIANLIANLDPDILKRMSTNLTNALEGIDAINAFGKQHGESRIGAAAGIEIDTGFMQGEYSAALEQAFASAGVSLKAAIDDEGNERVYAAINNVGESWHKAITQWKTSEITPEIRAFLDELGVEVYTSGQYTMVSTESILENLATTNHSKLTEILFDNAEMWSQFPEDVQQAFIDAGIATEDGFIMLTGEMIDGWYRYQTANGMQLARSFEAMDTETKNMFANLSGNTVIGWESLTNEQLYYLEQLGITSEAQYNKNADELYALVTNKMGILNGDNLVAWQDLSSAQLAQLEELGITTEEQYNAHASTLQLAATGGMELLREFTVQGWNELSDTTLQKLSDMGITTEEQYQAYLDEMNVKTGAGLSTVDSTTQQKLLELGVTTASGWGAIKETTDEQLTETEHIALGHVKFADLPEAIRNALAEGRTGSAYDALHDSWWAINADAESQLGSFNDTVDSMQNAVDRVKDLAQQLRAALNDPSMQAEVLYANLSSFQSSAIKAADSGNNSWAVGEEGHSYYSDDGGYSWYATSGKWEGWDNNIEITGQSVAINEDVLDSAGNPSVYYIYDLNVDGKEGQIIRNQNGVWKKYLGGRPHDAYNNLPYFKMGGIVTGDGLFRAGEFGMHEAIVPMEQPQAMRAIGNALAAAIPAYQLVAPLEGMLGRRDGGVAPFSSFHKEETEQSVEDIVNRILDAQAHRAPQPSYNGGGDGDRRPLYVGTLIADKAGLRELDRQMKRVSRQDGGR